MYIISKTFKWSSSHQLSHLEDNHKCSRNHGHNYKAIIYLKSKELNKDGFVLDFAKLKDIGDYIKQNWDHRNLSKILYPEYATSEIIAKILYNKFKTKYPQLLAIEIWETDYSCSRYEPEEI